LGIPLPERGVRSSNHGRSFDRRDVWVELNSPDRLPTSRGRRCREVRKRKRKTLLGEKKEKERSVLKNSLTTPALLEMSGNSD